MPYTIEDARASAEERGGRCLSAAHTCDALEWECAAGHTWKAPYASIWKGHWCKRWAPVGRPRTATLDMYNEELRLAVEYDGRRHSERVEFSQRTEAAYEALRARDSAKSEAADANGVSLIRVPHTVLEGVRGPAPQKEVLARFLWREVEGLGYPPGTTTATLADALAALGGPASSAHF